MMLEQMALEMDENLQREIDKVDSMEARNDDYIIKIECSYDEDGDNEPDLELGRPNSALVFSMWKAAPYPTELGQSLRWDD